MKPLIANIVLICLLFDFCYGKLTPTPLVSGRVYHLLSQHDGRYLTDSGGGVPTKAEGNGGLNQQFTLVADSSDKDAWMLIALSSNVPLSNALWKVSYVGHGKYQFKNRKTGKCLGGIGGESTCGKNNPMQRWFLEFKST